MRTWRTVTAAAMAACLCAAILPGQTATSSPAIPDGWVSLDIGRGTYKEFFAACELSPEQQKKILNLVAANNDLVKEFNQAILPVALRINKAAAAKDETTRSEAMQENMRICREYGPKMQKSESAMNDGILAVMSNQQKVRWRTYCVLRGIKLEYSPANLTDKQWDQVMDACEPLAKDFSTPQVQVEAKLKAKMVDVLTVQQKAKFWLAKAPYADMAKVCNLTEEQIQKIVKIEDNHWRQLPAYLEKGETEIAQLKQASDRATSSGDQETAVGLNRQWALKWDILHNTYRLPSPNYSCEEVLAVLTEKQKAAWREHVKAMPGSDVYKKLVGGS
jgi:hypothetical protein